MIADPELLRRYAEENSEAAFAELVGRHLGLVYGAALRQLDGAQHRAQDVAQSVFVDLARQAGKLARREEIVGWLYTSTHYAAAKLKRTEHRRALREQEAHAMHETLGSDSGEINWAQLRPVLDDAMRELDDRDRSAVLLRFFAQRPFAEIGAVLHVSEDAARMRVDRALGRLHGLLAKRGVTSTAAALSAGLAHQVVAAVPAGLAAAVTGTALAGAAASGGAASVAGVVNFMSATKIITTAAGVVALFAIGAAIHERGEAEASAAALVAATRERDTMRARLAQVETRAQQSAENLDAVQKELAALRTSTTSAPAAPAPAALPGAKLMTSLSASPIDYVLEHPDKRSAYIDQEVLRARARFERFFRESQLSPEQQERFLKNLREFAEQKLDFLGAVRIYGYNLENMPTDSASVAQMGRMEKQIPLDLQNNMRALLGDDGFNQYQQYTRTLPLRNAVNDLASRLYETDTPLTAAQADQLTTIMAQNPFRTPVAGFKGNTIAGTFIPVMTYNAAKTQLNLQGASTLTDWHEPVSDAAVAQAAAVLSQPQLAALRRVQEQQVAQLLGAPPLLGPDRAAQKPKAAGGK